MTKTYKIEVQPAPSPIQPDWWSFRAGGHYLGSAPHGKRSISCSETYQDAQRSSARPRRARAFQTAGDTWPYRRPRLPGHSDLLRFDQFQPRRDHERRCAFVVKPRAFGAPKRPRPWSPRSARRCSARNADHRGADARPDWLPHVIKRWSMRVVSGHARR
jgi:hypothetical protein